MPTYNLFAHPLPTKHDDGSLTYPPATVPVLKYVLRHYYEMPQLVFERDLKRDLVWMEYLNGQRALADAKLNRELARVARAHEDGFALWDVVLIAAGSAAGAAAITALIAGLAAL